MWLFVVVAVVAVLAVVATPAQHHAPQHIAQDEPPHELRLQHALDTKTPQNVTAEKVDDIVKRMMDVVTAWGAKRKAHLTSTGGASSSASSSAASSAASSALAAPSTGATLGQPPAKQQRSKEPAVQKQPPAEVTEPASGSHGPQFVAHPTAAEQVLIGTCLEGQGLLLL